jgi:hypothetical protein
VVAIEHCLLCLSQQAMTLEKGLRVTDGELAWSYWDEHIAVFIVFLVAYRFATVVVKHIVATAVGKSSGEPLAQAVIVGRHAMQGVRVMNALRSVRMLAMARACGGQSSSSKRRPPRKKEATTRPHYVVASCAF